MYLYFGNTNPRESKRIATSKGGGLLCAARLIAVLMTRASSRLSQSLRTVACVLAVGSDEKKKLNLTEPSARGEGAKATKPEAGPKGMRGHQRAAASGDKPEKKP